MNSFYRQAKDKTEQDDCSFYRADISEVKCLAHDWKFIVIFFSLATDLWWQTHLKTASILARPNEERRYEEWKVMPKLQQLDDYAIDANIMLN